MEPIVTEELFYQVQRQLDKNRSESPRNTKLVYLLQHLLWCRVCGKPFLARSHSNRQGKPLKTPERYYGCRGMRVSPGAYNCRKPSELYASTTERVVWNRVAEAFADPQALLEILKARNATATDKAKTARAELDLAKGQLKKKDKELQQLLTWARQRLLTADELRPQLAQVREQKEDFEREVERLAQKLRSLEAGDKNLVDAEWLCFSVRDRLASLTAQEQKEFLQLVVERVWVDKDNNMEIEVIVPSVGELPATGVICETAHSHAGERRHDLGTQALEVSFRRSQ